MRIHSTKGSRRRVPRWLVLLGSLVVGLGLVGLTPLQGPALQAGGRPEPYDLYLPPGYNTPANQPRSYPVLYLLHGAPGQPSDWIHGLHEQQLEDQGVASGALLPMIIVMPEGNGGVWHDSQSVNTVGGFRAEDLIAHHVMHYVDAHYRTLANRRARAIAGICEGGFGAMNPDLKWSRHLWIDLWSCSKLLESYIRLSEMNISLMIVPIVWPVRGILGIVHCSRSLRMLSWQ